MERSEYMKDIHRWENMRLNISTFKKKKGYLTGVLLCLCVS